MKDEPKQIWLDALEGDEYVQARDTFTNDDGGHCCLAVLTHEAADRDVPGIRWIAGRNDFDVLIVLEPGEDWATAKTVEQAAKALETYVEFDSNSGNYYPSDHEGEGTATGSYYDWVSWEKYGDAALPPLIADWAGLEGTNPKIGDDNRAIELNDTERLTFEQIAERVREHL